MVINCKNISETPCKVLYLPLLIVEKCFS